MYERTVTLFTLTLILVNEYLLIVVRRAKEIVKADFKGLRSFIWMILVQVIENKVFVSAFNEFNLIEM